MNFGKILVVEPEHVFAQVLVEQGYTVIRIGYKEVIKGPGKEVPQKLRNKEITGIGINYHQWKKHIDDDIISKCHKEIHVWIKHATEMSLPVFVFGITGTHWSQYVWEQMLLDKLLYESKHRLCTFNLRFGESKYPSNLCIKILSTMFKDSTPCKCCLDFKDHINDWKPGKDDHGRMTHRNATLKVFRTFVVDQRIIDFGNSEQAFPTDEREEWKRKRKENKEKGIEVKKKIKIVEEHYDDCGTNLAGLGNSEFLFNIRQIPTDEEPIVKGLCEHWLKGSFWCESKFNSTSKEMNTLSEMFSYLDTIPDGIDLVEICGGEGRTSILAIRRQLLVGENFDLVTHWDLNNQYDQDLVVMYLKKYCH